jgi:hypothetical protein
MEEVLAEHTATLKERDAVIEQFNIKLITLQGKAQMLQELIAGESDTPSDEEPAE